ncbi:MAG TPA: nitrous oxide reductase family maturation protein NosD [Alphaproteobacteria bacterium]|nr:nitrous oxide reductase family maturation protein NosD [Alphaproteobacteria bacterium]
MSPRCVTLPSVLAALAFAWAAGTACMGGARAATIEVEPGGGRLAATLAAAKPGDLVRLKAGVHAGPVVIDRPMVLDGAPGAVIDGGGTGNVITVTAPNVTVRGLIVRGSGASLNKMDAGIFLTESAHDALVERNRLTGNLFGVYLLGPKNAMVRHNVIIGRRDLRENDRGNGIQLWRTPGSQLIGNDIRYGRDGIFTDTSANNVFRGNRLRNLRIAIHYMYTNRSVIAGNISRNNAIGYAIMFSHRLTVTGNLSQNDREHGFLFNYANRSTVEGNIVTGGPEKCVFIYNANRNRYRGNVFSGCRIGIHFTAGSERNDISGNAFIGNRHQVKYVGTRALDWSRGGRGNYWSDNSGFDLNSDGIADAAYRPNSMVDRIVWAHPSAKILLNSPAATMLRWAQSRFPALYPGGVVDSAPLMAPPRPKLPVFVGELR